MLIPYPADQEIQYALRLKQFGAQLPALAARYQLPTCQVLRVQCLALEFMELLICHLHCATAARQCGAAGLPPAPSTHPELAAGKAAIQRAAQQLARCIQQHPAYTAADGHLLGLPLPAC